MKLPPATSTSESPAPVALTVPLSVTLVAACPKMWPAEIAPVSMIEPALVSVMVSPVAVSVPALSVPDVVVVKLMLRPVPPAVTVVAVKAAAALLSVMAPSVVVAEVTVSAPPPDWANVIGALAPTVVRLLKVVADALLFAILYAAAHVQLVGGLSDARQQVTW